MLETNKDLIIDITNILNFKDFKNNLDAHRAQYKQIVIMGKFWKNILTKKDKNSQEVIKILNIEKEIEKNTELENYILDTITYIDKVLNAKKDIYLESIKKCKERNLTIEDLINTFGEIKGKEIFPIINPFLIDKDLLN